MIELGDGLVETIHAGEGFRMVMRDGMTVCADGQFDRDFNLKCVRDSEPLDGKRIAWIGGGYCIGATEAAKSPCTQTVYEIEPDLEEFCPKGVTFIPGDWRDTISGKFDIAVYDLGGPVPYDILTQYLAPGGLILPKEA